MDKGARILERSLVAGTHGTSGMKIGDEEAAAFCQVGGFRGLKWLDIRREDSREDSREDCRMKPSALGS